MAKLIIYIISAILTITMAWVWLGSNKANSTEYIGDATYFELDLTATQYYILDSMAFHHTWDGDQTDYTKGSWANMSATVK